MVSHVLGTGRLTWNPIERINDRYGMVWLIAETSKTATGESVPLPQGQAEEYGQLVAEVLATRPSSHGGDLMRQIYSTRPEIGERIVLGEGILFFRRQDEKETVGLRPLDGRETDWLDPHQLYRAHDQTVRLVFEPVPVPHEAAPPEPSLPDSV
jgi:hypothetical protein